MRNSLMDVEAVVLAADVNGLGTIRALHKQHHKSISIAMRETDPVLRSRLPKASFVVPRNDDFVRSLTCLLMDLRIPCRPVLIPTSDEFVYFLAEQRELLAQKYSFILPETELLRMLLDKKLETQLLETHGIPIPRTMRCLDTAPNVWHEHLRFPVIVKPRSARDVRYLGKKNVILAGATAATEFSRRYADSLQHVVAQEIIPGPDNHQWVCNCVFSREHLLINGFTFQRLHLSPAHFGVTSVGVSCRNDEVIALVERIGKLLRYVGPAMFEFKWDERDGEYKYIEMNPRLGMCNSLDTRCGVDNVLATFRLAREDNQPAPRTPQVEGILYICLFADIYARLKDGDRLLAIVAEYFRYSLRPWVHAYWSWYDPWPALWFYSRKTAEVVRSFGQKTLRYIFRSRRN